MPDLISVLMPAYNHGQYIRQAINSVIEQTYDRIELIVIDDGSQDNTWDIIQQLSDQNKERFARIVFETQENQGTNVTCKKLLEKAQGKYVCFLASDDAFKPDALQKMYDVLLAHPECGLVVGDNELIDGAGTVIHWDVNQRPVQLSEQHIDGVFKSFGAYLRRIRPDVDFLSDNFGSYETLLDGNYVPNGYLIRKNIIDNIDAYNALAPLEDWYLMLQISKQSTLKFVDEVLFSYRWHSANSMKNTARMWELTRITFDFEIQNMLSQKKGANAQRIKDFFNSKRRFYIRIGALLSFSRVKNFLYKEYFFVFFNQKYSRKIYRRK